MGYLFENMEKMDIQAERRNTQDAQKEAMDAKEKAEKALEKGIELFVVSMQQMKQDKKHVVRKIAETYDLSEEEAEKRVNRYWKQ